MKDKIITLAASLILFVSALFGFVALNDVAAAPLHQDGTRALMTVTALSRSGVEQSLSNADGDGLKFSNNGQVFIVANNAYTAVTTLTFVTPGTVDGLEIEDLTVDIPVGETHMIGPFPPSQYNQITGSDRGRVYLNFESVITGSQVASVTVGAFRLP